MVCRVSALVGFNFHVIAEEVGAKRDRDRR
jgi:hypothetical protein